MPSKPIPMPAFAPIPLLLVAMALLIPVTAVAQTPVRTVQPGAPGEASRVVAPSDGPFASSVYAEADVHFMQMMIPHHAQALQMSELVPERSARDDVRLLAYRIHLAQADEIGLMARWLADRDEEVPPEAAIVGFGVDDAGHAHDAHAGDHEPARQPGHADHGGHGDHDLMPGMLTPEQFAELEAASGEEFDRLFLELMIFHHEGALTMVADLFASPDGGQNGEIFQLAAHVDSDQRIEIDRMRRMLAMGSGS